MCSLAVPPTYEVLVEQDGKPKSAWILFFSNMVNGDAGASWTPTFVSLTEVGTATKTGRYWRINKSFAYFEIVITPGTNTSSTAGTTYCDNFPLDVAGQSVCHAMTVPASVVAGTVETNNRIYPPSWTTITSPVTLAGLVRIA
jgi:hypothetical protein